MGAVCRTAVAEVAVLRAGKPIDGTTADAAAGKTVEEALLIADPTDVREGGAAACFRAEDLDVNNGSWAVADATTGKSLAESMSLFEPADAGVEEAAGRFRVPGRADKLFRARFGWGASTEEAGGL